MLQLLAVVLLVALCCSSITFAQPAVDSMQVRIDVDAGKDVGEFKPIWKFYGADEPNYTYMKHGEKLLSELGKIGPAPAFFRTHNLLTTGDGTPALKWGSTNAYTEDAQGNPVYDWTIVDRIFDVGLRNGVKPYVQIGFMPEAMSTKPQPYHHHWSPEQKYDAIFTGWAHPPKDYDKWGELVYQWAKHCVEKYGKAEVESWYWQTWNESNAGYWQGKPEEFYRLHDVSIAAVRRALPTARVGGCDTAGDGGKFMTNFLEHCLRGKNYSTGETGTPLDFLSFHAKGAPKSVDGHVQMGIAAQLRTIDTAFKRFAHYPELKSKPIVIGESDPEGCAACQGPQFNYRNGTLYSSYTAASFTRKYALADKHGVNLEGAVTWAFEFEDQPYFAGQRVLATNGVDLPVLNVFRMFSLMPAGRRIGVASSAAVDLDEIVAHGVRKTPDISAFATAIDGKLAVMAWHYHDDDVAGPVANVSLNLAGLVAGDAWRVTEYRVDANHANAFTAWKNLGSPQSPTPKQYKQLEAAGKLAPIADPATINATGGKATLTFSIDRQTVALFVIERI